MRTSVSTAVAAAEGNGHTLANSDGSAQLVLLVTMDEYASGDMTVVDFPCGFPIHIAGGKVSAKANVKSGRQSWPNSRR